MKARYLWVIAAAITLFACSQPEPQLYVHISGTTMGTTFNIKFPEQSEIDVNNLEDQINSRLIKINKLMSTYDPESELSRFNQHRFTSPFSLSDETVLVIKEALRLGELSNGFLDVTVGPLVNLWGFGPTKRPEKVPTDAMLKEVSEYVGLDKIQLSGNQLRKSHALLYVDLSTIAKGYGVDELAKLLEKAGINDYLVEIGGEMRIKGTKYDNQPWLIAIEKPVTNERAIQKLVSIGDNAIATSGDYRNFFEEEGVRYSHLINPKTGKPIEHNTVSVAVVHESSMVADGLATTFNVMQFDDAFKLAQDNELAVLFIIKEEEEFKEVMTSAFKHKVDTH